MESARQPNTWRPGAPRPEPGGYDRPSPDGAGYASGRGERPDAVSPYAPSPYGAGAHPAAPQPHPESTYDYSDPARVASRLMGGEAAPGGEHYDRGYDDGHGYDDQQFDDRAGSSHGLYDDPTYGSEHADENDYEAEGYYDDDQALESDEEMYDDEPPARRRGGLVMALGVAALAVLGTAGAFAYRSVFAGGPQTPPVIKAEAGPNKVAPAGQSDSQSSKLIYDRLGDSGRGEKVVSREEQPLDVGSAAQPSSGPRIVFPPLVTNAEATTSGPPDTPAAAPFPAPTRGVGTEPKKVHTVTIHPDGADPFARAAPPALPPQTQPTRTAAAVPVSTRSVAPTGGAAPLSLVPQPGSAHEAARPTTTASVGPASTHTAHHPAATGGFNVQLLAQKTEEEAQTSFRALQAKYPSVLSGREPVIRRKDLGDKGVFYGAQIGPFASREEANQLCSKLKSLGGSCLVQKN
ncbi:MAG TPA: SPOR domain-containing protein [Xanthobacteraceae bacterium]|nr:SPOR domain-containing protein [Xanthobacteraceae bacterium]